MSQGDLVSLTVVLAASAGAVFLADALRGLRVPVAVLEILVGVLIGPHALALASATDLVDGLARLGVWFLFFVGGHEVVVKSLRGWPLRAGLVGWIVSAGLAVGVALALGQAGLQADPALLALALTTTALGLLVPIVRDASLLRCSLGRAVTAAAVCGWLGPLLALTFVASPRPWPETAGRLAALLALVVVSGVLVRRVRPLRRVRLLQTTLSTSAQLAVRGAGLLLIFLVLSAALLDVSALLGAFCAGLLVRYVESAGEARALRLRLDAIGFGLLIPVFLVSVGMSLDVSVFASAGGIALGCAFLLSFALVRGLPSLLLLRRLGLRRTTAASLLTSTKLPLLAVIAGAAVQAGEMSTATASTLIGAGMVTVVLFPPAALRLLGVGAVADERGAGSSHESARGAGPSLCAGETVRQDDGQTPSEGARDAQPL